MFHDNIKCIAANGQTISNVGGTDYIRMSHDDYSFGTRRLLETLSYSKCMHMVPAASYN